MTQKTENIKLSLRLCLVVLATAMLFTACEKEQKAPNFLFVLVDDQSPFDLKIYNPKSILETPVIETDPELDRQRLAGKAWFSRTPGIWVRGLVVFAHLPGT